MDVRSTPIEERLDSLVGLMKTTGLPQDDVGLEEFGRWLERQAMPKQKSQPNKTPDPNNPWFVPNTYNCHAPTSCICRLEAIDPPPPPDTDDALLKVYRMELMPSHPFVVIGSSTVAATLRTKTPFLMAAIRMAASRRSLRSMKSQMYRLMKELSDRMLVQSERSMDLLLGIIVILGYYHNHCFLHAQLGNLLNLAVTLTGDLGLTRPPEPNKRSSLFVARSSHPVPRTNEERRALVGVWFLSSAVALSLGRVESTTFTRYIHQCLQELEQAMEYMSDVGLVQLVRVQHLNARIARFASQQRGDDEMPMFETAQIPRDVCVAAFEKELILFRRNLPASLRQDKIIHLYIHTATLRLHEPPALDSDLLNSLFESSTCSLGSSNALLDQLYKAHAGLTAWFDDWLSVPVSLYHRQTIATCSTLVYAVSLLTRWAKMTAPATTNKAPDQVLGNSAGPSCSASPATVANIDTGLLSAEFLTASSRLGSEPSLRGFSLQAHLKQQHPGLQIDIHAILSTVQLRFQQASDMLQESCVEPESNDQNIWSMSAIKILITRAKLQRWTEIVSKATEEQDYMKGIPSYADMRGSSGNAMAGGYFGIDGIHIPNFSDEMLPEWMVNSTPGTGDASWLDGYLAWTEMMMNSTQNARPQHGR
ncbi:hypothetical protein NW762_010187 [Fusarium torreyae]|uniref:Transcription factor domain-containing protein n=1 Tax=Fusarium torreyae TaxID=1237075 RepID=A0A9W8RRQ3_9HYPO|nr:hypothetical protein NW762_010187 [Fusarium torreyae]